MEFKNLIEILANFGVPTVLLFWVLFRLDRFLDKLVTRLEVYNNELGEVGNALKDIVKLVGDK